MLRLSPWCKIFWTPTSWSETCVAGLHSLFIFIPSMRTLATEKLFGHGQGDDVSVMAWRSFTLKRKIAGSNKGENQALVFAHKSLWLARSACSEMHGASMRRWHLDEAVRQVGGMLITDSRGIFDALTRSQSPQLRLRSSRTGEEARGIKEQRARIHWVNTLTMLADSLTKPGYPARAVTESFLVKMEMYLRSYLRVLQSSKSKRSTFVQ